MYPLGDGGGFCVAQHGSFNWEKPGLCFFLNVPCGWFCMYKQPNFLSLCACVCNTANFRESSSSSTGKKILRAYYEFIKYEFI
jgi:hypothetical protein